MVRMIVVVACSLAVLSVGATAQDSWVTDDQYAEMQKNFAESNDRKDADAMAAVFADNGIRVTPSGRDAIRRDSQNMLAIGLHDYSVHRTPS